MKKFGVACGAIVALAALFAAPARSLAATTASCEPGVNVPESPGGAALLVAAAFAVLGVLVLIRRRGGAPPAALATIVMVVIAGAILSMTGAGAATDPCSGGGVSGSGSGGGGGVLGSSTGTPFTGAAIPWITATVLVVLGLAAVTVGLSRRRSRGRTHAERRMSERASSVDLDEPLAAQAATVIAGVRHTTDRRPPDSMAQPRVLSDEHPAGGATNGPISGPDGA